jgi:hypothetical protein
MDLFRQRETKTGAQFIEAIGGSGINDIIRTGEEDGTATKKRLISVGYIFRYSRVEMISLNQKTINRTQATRHNHVHLIHFFTTPRRHRTRLNTNLRHPFTPTPSDHIHA